ncbi:MAG: uracil-DNA glycosylase family protein [Gammaproteobacteria bacterium]
MTEIDRLYAECMNCPKEVGRCPGTWRDIPGGVPPRGFRDGKPGVQLLVVAKNPGHPLNGEREALSGHTGRELLTAYRAFQETFKAKGPAEASGRFHRNLRRYLEYFLECEGPQLEAIVASTNLVKCSSPNERAPLQRRTMVECYDTYLRKEVALMRPKVVLALGNEVRDFLNRQKDLGVPVIGIKHPSYFYRRDLEAGILAEIKRKIQQALRGAAQQAVQRDGPASGGSAR